MKTVAFETTDDELVLINPEHVVAIHETSEVECEILTVTSVVYTVKENAQYTASKLAGLVN